MLALHLGINFPLLSSRDYNPERLKHNLRIRQKVNKVVVSIRIILDS
jgi:hypothetical protein